MTNEHDQHLEQPTRWTGGRDTYGDFAPGLVHYTDAVLFDEVWERPDLSKRDRSLVTVAALTALGRTEQLSFHLRFALDNGVTQDGLTEALLHLAFYTGWPNGMSASVPCPRRSRNSRACSVYRGSSSARPSSARPTSISGWPQMPWFASAPNVVHTWSAARRAASTRASVPWVRTRATAACSRWPVQYSSWPISRSLYRAA